MRHHVERGITVIMLGISVVLASKGMWTQANYFLFLSALVDFDDWSRD